MTRILAVFSILWLSLAGAAIAEPAPVVVELFTSQGCSSCPPADEMLGELAKHDDIIALALHVDYWDYIGWKDVFGSPVYTNRQKSYARADGSRSIYTPQVVIGGKEKLAFRAMAVAELIQEHRSQPAQVRMTLVRDGDRVTVTASAERALTGKYVLQLVRYMPEQEVKIERGENAGRTILYHNIVTSWVPVAKWDGQAPMEMSFDVVGKDPIVAILQEQRGGEIIAAKRLR